MDACGRTWRSAWERAEQVSAFKRKRGEDASQSASKATVAVDLRERKLEVEARPRAREQRTEPWHSAPDHQPGEVEARTRAREPTVDS